MRADSARYAGAMISAARHAGARFSVTVSIHTESWQGRGAKGPRGRGGDPVADGGHDGIDIVLATIEQAHVLGVDG